VSPFFLGIHEGRIGMAVLVRHRPQGLGPAQYDEISPALVEKVKQQPGFVLHVAFEDSQGFCVAEIWESQEQHDAWFNENVVPNVPAEISQEVVQIHNVIEP
jgi:quinol monooxygenase YgiN